jgi:hypothetical protein
MAAHAGKESRTGGCILMVFGAPFFLLGSFFFITAWLNYFNIVPPPEEFTVVEAIGLSLFAMIFIIVGGLICWRGFLAFTGRVFHTERPGATAPPPKVDRSREVPFLPAAPRTLPAAGGVMLRTQFSRFAGLIGNGLFVLFWYGLSIAGLVSVLRSGERGFMLWLIVGFLTLLLLVGLFIVREFLKGVARLLVVGRTGVLVPREHVRPGERFRVALHQEGDFAITRARIALCCEEIISYQSGKHRSVRRETVFREVAAEGEDLRADSSRPVLAADVTIPPGAMHSFMGRGNKIQWSFHVVVEIPGRPDVEEVFPFRVIPRGLSL